MPLHENPRAGLNTALFNRLAAGQRVQLLGTRDVSGAIRAEIIIVPERLNPLSGAELDAAIINDDTTATRPVRQTEDIQQQRGTYGTTLTRPELTRETLPVVRPNVIERRPVVRPEI